MYICIYVYIYIYMIPPRLWDVSDGGVHPPEAKAKAGFFFPPASGLTGSDGSGTSHPRPIPTPGCLRLDWLRWFGDLPSATHTEHELFINYSWIHHELFMNCSWINHNLSINYQWTIHELIVNCSCNAYELFMNYSWIIHISRYSIIKNTSRVEGPAGSADKGLPC